jgi:4-hydroxy-tetrahydrodipicolinate synthase
LTSPTAIHGLWPALLIAVQADQSIDTPRTIAHAQRMLAAGSDGITLFGTTGEGPAFTVAERQEALEALLASGVQPGQIIVTITALALGDVVALGRHAAARGVHRQMMMPPFYFNQPRDAGVVAAVSHAVQGIGDDKLKLVLYHFPAMSTYGFSHSAVAELVSRHPGQVIGIKDSSGDMAHAQALARAFGQLSILVGTEPHIAPTMLVGGSGSINGLANIAPRLLRRVIDAPAAVSADDTQLMNSLLAILSVQPGMNFVTVYKTMLAEQTGDNAWLNVRSPLSALTGTEQHAVRTAYRAIGSMLASV